MRVSPEAAITDCVEDGLGILARACGLSSGAKVTKPWRRRLGDIATKLPDEVIKATPEIPWREVKGMRVIAAHADGVGLVAVRRAEHP